MQELKFLDGPQSRWNELKMAVEVFAEFLRGFRVLHFVGPCVTVFGSARFKEDHPEYIRARELGAALAKEGFTVMTGGGPGIMEAANRGAQEAGGRSVGCNIILPKEQFPNKYLDKWVSMKYFFVRKTLLIKYSYAFVICPGGFGTLDEFFEAITLVQTGKIAQFPIVILSKEFHEKLLEHIDTMLAAGTISVKDKEFYIVTDSVQTAVQHIVKNTVKPFGLTYRPKDWLGEKY